MKQDDLTGTVDRRTILILGALGIGAGGGYLWWMRRRSPSLPEEMDAETLHLERDALTGDSARERGPLDWRDEFHTIVADADTAASDLVDTGRVSGFVDETDFERSYILLVQNGMQSEMELVLEEITRTDGGIHAELEIDPPSGGGPDDLIVHSLLIRITDESRGVPDLVSVDIDGYV